MRNLISENLKYNGKRFSVYDRIYENDGQRYIRNIVKAGEGSIVLPIDENNNVIFVKQYREILERETLELPAGVIDGDEKPEHTAIRELEEEAGIVAKKIEHLISFYPSCGITDERVHIFLASDFEKGNTNFDEDEQITGTIRIPLEECYKMQGECKFEHASTNIALMMYKLYKDKK